MSYHVMVSYKKGPTEIYGGINTTYESEEVAQDVANELVTYEYGVTEAWVEKAHSVNDSNHLDPRGLRS